MNVFVIVLVPAALVLLGWSTLKDSEKTKQSLEVAKGMFLNIGGEIFGLLLLVALFFTLVPEGAVESLLGGTNVFLSSVYGALMGTVLILPKFVAMPLASDLIAEGAHIVVAAGFITTLTMVGFATLPVEIDHFGKKYTLVRNVLSFIFALLIAVGMMVML